MNPLISIVTVCFNAVNNIEETILSVISQSYENIEYIIIDGGSTDGTVDIIKKYESKIHYWISEPDKGIYDAMNKGIDKAIGEWINFMNAGDSFCDNNTVEQCVLSIKNNSNTDIIYGDTIAIFKNGKFLSTPKNINLLNKHTVFCHQSSFIKTSVASKYKFDVKYKILADYNLFRKLYFSNYIFKYINIPISNYEAENGISSTMFKKIELEYAQINHQNNMFRFSIAYIKIQVKELIRKIIPISLLNKRKIKNISRNPYLKKI